MKNPTDLTHEELVEVEDIVTSFLRILYWDRSSRRPLDVFRRQAVVWCGCL